MRAIIPVAGFGKRLKPHTYSLPKVLLNVGGKPILAHILDKLVEEKIYKTTFIIGYLGEKIIEFVEKDYPQIKADFVRQDEMLGLGHAIYQAVPTFDEDEIFILLGDTVFDLDMHEMLRINSTALGVKTVEDPSRFGVAVTENGKITKLVEKPDKPISKLALVGLYSIKNPKLLTECLEEIIKNNIKTRGEYQLTDALQLMIEKGERIETFPIEGWYDCGKSDTLLSTNEWLLSRNGSKYSIDNVVINEPVFIADSAVITNSVIGPNTTIAENCIVSDSIIKNSIINEDAKVDRSMLENSIIGSHASVKGNYRRLNTGDSSEIEIY